MESRLLKLFSKHRAAIVMTVAIKLLIEVHRVVMTTPAALVVKEGSINAHSATEKILSNRAQTGVEAQRSPIDGRIIYHTLSLSALGCLCAMLSSRVKTLWPYRRTLFRSDNVLRLLSVSVPFMGVAFVVSANFLLNIWDVNTDKRCRAAILICLAFYVGQKALEYAYMNERYHQLTLLRRRQDYCYLALVLAIVVGFGSIAVAAFINPVTGVSSIDGQCRIGLALPVTIPLLTYDVCLNIGVTIIFAKKAIELAQPKSFKDIITFAYQALPFVEPKFVDQNGMLLFQCGRALLGCVAIIAPTVFNLVVLFKVHGHELAWLCLSICTADVGWSTFVIHWLTSTAQSSCKIDGVKDDHRSATESHELDIIHEV